MLRSQALLAALLALGTCGCNRSAGTEESGSKAIDGHQRMLALLEEVRRRTPDENAYLGDAEPRQLAAALARLPASAPEVDRFVILWRLGAHQVRLGETRRGIDYLLQADALFPRARAQLDGSMRDLFLLHVATAYLRLGENENCVKCTGLERCLLPIREGGVHAQPEGALKAIERLQILLEQNPRHATSRWLLNLAHMLAGSYPDAVPDELLIPPDRFESEPFPRLVNVAPDVGVDAFDLAGGSIVDDFDGDGYLDLVTSTSDTAGPMHYFKNDGDGSFTDRTDEAGLTGLYGGLNMLQADFDNDGDLDILVLRGGWFQNPGPHPNSLLRNDGRGCFRDVTFEAGLGDVHYPTQTAAWADYNNDGLLDLYIGNEGYPCQLFENEGNGTFADVALRAGVENGRYAKGVVWGDFNGDGWPDLYVSNHGEENRLYRNNRDGTFTDVAPELGVTGPIDSFPCWFWDFNNDGALDLYVSHWSPDPKYVAASYLGWPVDAEPPCLYQGDGQGGLRDVAAEVLLDRAVTSPMGANFGDIDNDGFPDVYLGTGAPEYEALMPNLLLHNRRGERFVDVSAAAGVGHLQKGHGVSFADLDNDGDQDLHIQMGGALPGDAFGNVLFENPGFGNHWLTIRLVGRRSNSYGIGARLRADFNEGGTARSVYQWVGSGGSFGANPLRPQIGIGKARTIDLLEVYWPTSGTTQQFRDVPAGAFIEITEGEPEYRRLPWQTVAFRRTPASP